MRYDIYRKYFPTVLYKGQNYQRYWGRFLKRKNHKQRLIRSSGVQAPVKSYLQISRN